MDGAAGGEDDAPPAFSCHRCGTCCTSLRGIWSRGEAPFSSMAGSRIYRLPTPGGLRMFAWEADRFPAHRLEPLLVVADAGRQRLVALAYEQDAQVCPNYDEEVGCTIYEDRPLVCQAYPLLVVEGEEGAEVAVSGLCPGKVPIARAAERADRPEPVLARAYPDEFAAALAVPATVQALSEVVGFLESAGVLDPVDGLTEDAIDRWRAKGTVDLVTIVEEAGVLGQEQLAERTRRIRRTIHERWADAGSGA